MEYVKLLSSSHGGNPVSQIDANRVPCDPAETIGRVLRTVPWRGEELRRGRADCRRRILTSMTGDTPQRRPGGYSCLDQQLSNDRCANLCVAFLRGPEATGDAMNHHVNRACSRRN